MPKSRPADKLALRICVDLVFIFKKIGMLKPVAVKDRIAIKLELWNLKEIYRAHGIYRQLNSQHYKWNTIAVLDCFSVLKDDSQIMSITDYYCQCFDWYSHNKHYFIIHNIEIFKENYLLWPN